MTGLFKLTTSLFCVVLATGHVESWQKTTQLGIGGGGSPHVKSEWAVDGAQLSVEYGRPYLRGRDERSVIPTDRPWRAGADAATVLRTDKTVQCGEVILKPGAYTVFVQVGSTWELLFGRLQRDGQWGSPYDRTLELGRVPIKHERIKHVIEQLTISVDDVRLGAILRLEWGTTRVTATFVVLRGEGPF